MKKLLYHVSKIALSFIVLFFLSGKILRGDDAPLAAELENWLKENPG